MVLMLPLQFGLQVCNSKMRITRFRGQPETTTLFRRLAQARETYLHKPLGGSPWVLTPLVKIIQFSQIHLYDWVDLWKSSAKKVTHPST